MCARADLTIESRFGAGEDRPSERPDRTETVAGVFGEPILGGLEFFVGRFAGQHPSPHLVGQLIIGFDPLEAADERIAGVAEEIILDAIVVAKKEGFVDGDLEPFGGKFEFADPAAGLIFEILTLFRPLRFGRFCRLDVDLDRAGGDQQRSRHLTRRQRLGRPEREG